MGHRVWAAADVAFLCGTHLSVRSIIWPTLNINIFIQVVSKDKKRKAVIMNNLKSAEAAKQAILDRIAKKIAASSEKTGVSALRHAAHCSSKTKHGNAYRH